MYVKVTDTSLLAYGMLAKVNVRVLEAVFTLCVKVTGVLVGMDDGKRLEDGTILGDTDGETDGCTEGTLLGVNDGRIDGISLGEVEGALLGAKEGESLGEVDGKLLGIEDGEQLGTTAVKVGTTLNEIVPLFVPQNVLTPDPSVIWNST